MTYRRSLGAGFVLMVAGCALPEAGPPPAGAGAGGTPGTGGSGPGGSTSTGGTAPTGGSATGGSATGGSATGGSATGGSATGGSATGGSATGGSATGGSATGGSATGGSATGGSATGGSGGGGPGGNAGASAAGAGNGGGGASGSAGKAGGNGGGAAGMGGMAGTFGGASGSAGKGGSSGGGPIVELAGNKTASADSEENNTTSNPPKVNLASSGNDGVSSTRWCAANAGQHYWQVDLGATHELVRVEIDFEYPAQASGFAYGYTVGTSGDGTTFTTAIDQLANTSTTMMQMAQFPAATTGRYVRITVTPPTTNPQTWSSFWEARVYGR